MRSEVSLSALFLFLPRQIKISLKGPLVHWYKEDDLRSCKTKLRPEIQLDDLFWYSEFLPIDDEIFIFHDWFDWFIGYNCDISIIVLPLRGDIYRFEIFTDRTSPLLPSQPSSQPHSDETEDRIEKGTYHNLFSMIRTHPFLSRIRRYCQWRIQAIQMP